MTLLAEPVRIEGGCVITSLRVPYADTDKMEHVYYGNYLVYFEVGRTEWMRAIGFTYREFEESGSGVPVVEAHVRYRGRIFYDDLIEVCTAAFITGRTRITFAYEIRRAGEGRVIASGCTVHAIVDMKTGKPRRIPDMLKELVERLPAAKKMLAHIPVTAQKQKKSSRANE